MQITPQTLRFTHVTQCWHLVVCVGILMLTEFGSLFIIRGVGKVGKLGRAGQHYQLEHYRKLHHMVALRTMEQIPFPLL